MKNEKRVKHNEIGLFFMLFVPQKAIYQCFSFSERILTQTDTFQKKLSLFNNYIYEDNSTLLIDNVNDLFLKCLKKQST